MCCIFQKVWANASQTTGSTGFTSAVIYKHKIIFKTNRFITFYEYLRMNQIIGSIRSLINLHPAIILLLAPVVESLFASPETDMG